MCILITFPLNHIIPNFPEEKSVESEVKASIPGEVPKGIADLIAGYTKKLCVHCNMESDESLFEVLLSVAVTVT